MMKMYSSSYSDDGPGFSGGTNSMQPLQHTQSPMTFPALPVTTQIVPNSLQAIPDLNQHSFEDKKVVSESIPEKSAVLQAQLLQDAHIFFSRGAPVRDVIINTADDLDNDNLTQALTSSLDSGWGFQEDASIYHSGAQSSMSSHSQGLSSMHHSGLHSNRHGGTHRSIEDLRSERKERSNGQQGGQHPAITMMPQYEPPLKNRERKEEHPSSQLWRSICMVGTFWMPDACIRKEGDTAKLAWRYVA
jgi:hypothetical protein